MINSTTTTTTRSSVDLYYSSVKHNSSSRTMLPDSPKSEEGTKERPSWITDVFDRNFTPSPTPSISSLSSSPSKRYSIAFLGNDAAVIDTNSNFDKSDPSEATQSIPSSSTAEKRIKSLEQQLESTRKHYEQALTQQELATQALVANLVEEKEQESLKVRQLVAVIEKQDALVLALQEKLSLQSQDDLIQELKSEIERLAGDKRALEQRMAAFLQEELDASQIELLSEAEDELVTNTLGMMPLSSDDDEVFSGSKSWRRSSSILDTAELRHSYHQRSNSSQSSLGRPVNSSNILYHRSFLNLVEEEEAVSGYSSLASSPTSPSFSPVSMLPRADSSFSIYDTESSVATSPPSAPVVARGSILSRSGLPPATPPPKQPLPPVPHALSTSDDAAVTIKSFPPPPPKILTHNLALSSSSPAAAVGKHASVDDLQQQKQRPYSIAPSPPSAPPGILKFSRFSMAVGSLTGSSSSNSIARLTQEAEAEQKQQQQHQERPQSSEQKPSTPASTTESSEEKKGFWKGVKKKWMIGR